MKNAWRPRRKYIFYRREWVGDEEDYGSFDFLFYDYQFILTVLKCHLLNQVYFRVLFVFHFCNKFLLVKNKKVCTGSITFAIL